MTLLNALTRSINTIAVKLSISIGNGNAKVGRAKIVKLAHDMGIRTPLPDTPSLPIGADEVTVLDHTGAYATFPNLGKAQTAHALLEVRTGTGDLVWRFDRDGPKPRQVMSPGVAADMAMLPDGARLEESLTQTRQIALVDSDPVVFHRHCKFRSLTRGCHHNLPIAWRELDGVRDQIDQDLVECAPVGSQLPELARGATTISKLPSLRRTISWLVKP